MMHPCDPDARILALPSPLLEVAVGGSDGARRDVVPEEVPVALVYNGISHAVMLASPTDLADFGLGFSLCEGVLRHPDELFDLEVLPEARGVVVQMHIAGERMAELKARRRALVGYTGCGLCGVESLEQLARPLDFLRIRMRIAPSALQRAMNELHLRQPLHARTGGVHAAAWAEPSGAVSMVREDVGRHNALDKLIGALARARRDLSQGFAVLTSRASVEMVRKAASVGIPMVAAVSAPTGYAIREADACGLTLAGFVRGARFALYSHPERIADQAGTTVS